MNDIARIFTMARETITAPNQLSLHIVPCAALGWGDPDKRTELSISAGEEYPPDAVWVAIIESDGSEELAGRGDSPDEALVALDAALRARVQTRLAALRATLGVTP